MCCMANICTTGDEGSAQNVPTLSEDKSYLLSSSIPLCYDMTYFRNATPPLRMDTLNLCMIAANRAT